MMFKTLAELLLLEVEGDDDLGSGIAKVDAAIRKGWKDTKDRFNDAIAKFSAEEKKKLQTDLELLIDQFFIQFPTYGSKADAEAFIKKYPKREQLVVAANALNSASGRVRSLLDGINRGIISSKKMTAKDMSALKSAVPIEIKNMQPETINFVKSEVAFFKQLITLDNDFKIDDEHFKTLLVAKVQKTVADKVPPAVRLLNVILTIFSKQMIQFAEYLAEHGRTLPKEVTEDTTAADRAVERLKKATQARKEQEREADRKNREAEAAAKKAVDAEEKIKAKAEKEAEAAIKSSSTEHKAATADAIQELRKDLEGFTQDMIDSFPFDGTMSTKEALDKFPTREAALAAFKAYRGIADRLEQLIAGMNRSLVSAGKVRDEQIKRYQVQAARMLKGGNPSVPASLIRFVKAESKFFKQLIQLDDDMKLDAEEFKDRLTVKMNQTDAARIPDAAQALNLLFGYISAKYRQNARTIADVGRSLDDENRKVKKTARDAAASKAAAEVEANAKSNGR